MGEGMVSQQYESWYNKLWTLSLRFQQVSHYYCWQTRISSIQDGDDNVTESERLAWCDWTPTEYIHKKLDSECRNISITDVDFEAPMC
jgi:hypothetical protein